jgi:phage-related protein
MVHKSQKRKSRLSVIFYKEDSGGEPVREWLHGLTKPEKKIIGMDIKTVQFGWPIGMPLIRHLGGGLWEIRSTLKDKISRVFVAIYRDNIVLLHGIIKKSGRIPTKDLELARKRLAKFKK